MWQTRTQDDIIGFLLCIRFWTLFFDRRWLYQTQTPNCFPVWKEWVRAKALTSCWMPLPLLQASGGNLPGLYHWRGWGLLRQVYCHAGGPRGNRGRVNDGILVIRYQLCSQWETTQTRNSEKRKLTGSRTQRSKKLDYRTVFLHIFCNKTMKGW